MLWDESPLQLLALTPLASLFIYFRRVSCRPGWHQTHYVAKDDPGLLIFLSLAPNSEIIDILSLCICLFDLRQGLTVWPILQLRVLLPQPAQHWEYKKASCT